MKGDWHDTFQLGTTYTRVRFQTDVFTGDVMIHCHYLQHEDEGMLMLLRITGKEGSTWPAEEIDPTCYRGAFPGFAADHAQRALLPSS